MLLGTFGPWAGPASVPQPGAMTWRAVVVPREHGGWSLIAGRSIAAIPFVRVQIARWRGGSTHANGGGRAQVAGLAGLAMALAAVALDLRLALGAAAVLAAVGLHWWWFRRPPRPPRSSGCSSWRWAWRWWPRPRWASSCCDRGRPAP